MLVMFETVRLPGNVVVFIGANFYDGKKKTIFNKGNANYSLSYS